MLNNQSMKLLFPLILLLSSKKGKKILKIAKLERELREAKINENQARLEVCNCEEYSQNIL